MDNDFKIEDGKTTIASELFVESNPDIKDSASQDMVLDGDGTCVKRIKLQIVGRDLVQGEVRSPCCHVLYQAVFSLF